MVDTTSCSRFRWLLVITAVAALSVALAQTSEGLAEAKRGTSAGSLEVFLAFIEEHDTTFYAEDAVFHVMAQLVSGSPSR
jgi:hypothetical protein